MQGWYSRGSRNPSWDTYAWFKEETWSPASIGFPENEIFCEKKHNFAKIFFRILQNCAFFREYEFFKGNENEILKIFDNFAKKFKHYCEISRKTLPATVH